MSFWELLVQQVSYKVKSDCETNFWIMFFWPICELNVNFSEKERQQCGISEACGCLWAYLTELRSFGATSHVHCNPFYDPLKYDGPLLPPAASLAPTLWPQFHLRWACPEEAKAADIEVQCRAMRVKYSETQKVTQSFLPDPFFLIDLWWFRIRLDFETGERSSGKKSGRDIFRNGVVKCRVAKRKAFELVR